MFEPIRRKVWIGYLLLLLLLQSLLLWLLGIVMTFTEFGCEIRHEGLARSQHPQRLHFHMIRIGVRSVVTILDWFVRYG